MAADQPILLFSGAELDRFVANALANQVPEDHTSAIVGAVDADGAQLVLSMKKTTERGEWRAEGVLRHTWTGANEIGARVIWSF